MSQSVSQSFLTVSKTLTHFVTLEIWTLNIFELVTRPSAQIVVFTEISTTKQAPHMRYYFTRRQKMETANWKKKFLLPLTLSVIIQLKAGKKCGSTHTTISVPRLLLIQQQDYVCRNDCLFIVFFKRLFLHMYMMPLAHGTFFKVAKNLSRDTGWTDFYIFPEVKNIPPYTSIPSLMNAKVSQEKLLT